MTFQESFNTRVIPAGNRAFGVSIQISHADSVTDPLTAVWEEHKYEVFDANGFATFANSRDFMFAVSDTLLGIDAFEPQPGDRITLTENGTVKTYEVMPVSESMPAVELMPGDYRWKVHTKRVK